MRTKEHIIELIREGKLVLDIDCFQGTQTAKDVLNEIYKYKWEWIARNRYYGTEVDGSFNGLNQSELNNREIVTLQEYLDSPSAVWNERPINFRPPTDKEINSLSEVDKGFEGSREYDEKLLREFCEGWKQSTDLTLIGYVKYFVKIRYSSDLLKEKEQLEQRIKSDSKRVKEINVLQLPEGGALEHQTVYTHKFLFETKMFVYSGSRHFWVGAVICRFL